MASREREEPPDPGNDYQRLLELLQFIHGLFFQFFPEHGPATAEGWFNIITAQYGVFGVPANLTEEERAQGRASIVEIKALMLSMPGLLDPQSVADFNQVLDQIYADLGG